MSEGEADVGTQPAGDVGTPPGEDVSQGEVTSSKDTSAGSSAKQGSADVRRPTVGASISELRRFWLRPVGGEEPGLLAPEHPLMQRFQKTLREYLERQTLRCTEELRDLDNELRQTREAREATGVRLYGLQQGVAAQQQQLDKCHEELERLAARRESLEEEVEGAREQRREASKVLAQQENEEAAKRRDLHKLLSDEREVSAWAEETRAELAVSQRAADKDKAQMRTLAEEKRRQDAFLYKLTTEVAQLRDHMAELAGKLRVKEQERREAGQAAADAAADVEVLQAEQRRLLGAWRGVVVLLQRRDQAYDAVLREREALEERLLALRQEAEGFRAAARAQMDAGETAAAALTRLEAERAAKERAAAAGAQRRDDLQRRSAEAQALVRHTDQELAASQFEGMGLERAAQSLQRDLDKKTERRRALEAALLDALSEQLRNDKAAQHLRVVATELRDRSREQALMLVEVEHTTGQVELEAARARGELDRRTALLEEMRREDSEAKRRVDEAELQLEQVTKVIGKRTSAVMTLSDRLEQLIAKAGGQELNPLEMRLQTLVNELRERETEMATAQAFWLRQQSHNVTLTQQRSEQLSHLSKLRKKVLVLDQKNVRLDRETERLGAAVAGVERSLHRLYMRLSAADAEASERRGRHEQAGRDAAATTDAFAAQLLEAEEQARELQAEVEALEEECEERTAKLLEAQHDQLAWEKKLRLVEQALDDLRAERSRDGETAAMRTEIHRMEVRRGQLGRAQERLVQDLEQSVVRRAAIAEGAEARESRCTRDAPPTRAVLRRRLEELHARSDRLRRDALALDRALKEERCRRAKMRRRHEELVKEAAAAAAATQEAERASEERRAARGRRLERLVRLQRRLRWLGELRAGRYRPLQRAPAPLDAELQRQRARAAALAAVAEALLADFPALGAHLHRMLGALQAA